MSNFSERMSAAESKYTQDEQHAAEKEQQKAEQIALDTARARLLGAEVVSYLVGKGVRFMPIREYILDGEKLIPERTTGIYGKIEPAHKEDSYVLKEVSKGVRLYIEGHYDDGPIVTGRTAIADTGILVEDSNCIYSRKAGIQVSRYYEPAKAIKIIESDFFAKAIVHVVRTGEPLNTVARQ